MTFNVASPQSPPSGAGNNEVQFNKNGAFASSELLAVVLSNTFGLPEPILQLGQEDGLGGNGGSLQAQWVFTDYAFVSGTRQLNLYGGGGAVLASGWPGVTEGNINVQSGNNSIVISPGSAITQVIGQLKTMSLGAGFCAKEGANGTQGAITLVAGSINVASTSITANSRIFLTSQADGGIPGFLRVSSRIPGTGFTITSSNALDTSTVAYEIFEPA